MQKQDKIKAIKEAVTLLAQENYKDLFHLDKAKRITSDEFEQTIVEYGGKVTIPPIEEFENFRSYADEENEVTIDTYLWVDGSKSDLTLSLFIEKENNNIRFSVDGIHVL